MDAPVELIQARIATKGWTPGRRDIGDLFAAWRALEDSEREDMQSRLARLDAPSVKKSIELWHTLDARGRGELTRAILKSYFKEMTRLSSEPLEAFPLACLADDETRARKAAAQAIGSSWSEMGGSLKKSLVSRLMENFAGTTDASEIKAIVDALGKSGDADALRLLTASRQPGATRAALTLRRDVLRGDAAGDLCHPERLAGRSVICWFTPGIEMFARTRAPFLGAEVLEPGILRADGLAWSALASEYLWKAAGIELGTVDIKNEDLLPTRMAELLAKRARDITAATTIASGGPARIRLGRDDGRSRGFVWDFAEALALTESGLMNDGRDAHWELRLVHNVMVLLPLKTPDERFFWRDATADGASDPTIAAALALMAEIKAGDVVYDPFCGAATELILASELTEASRLIGTDLNPRAIDAALRAKSHAGPKASGIRLEIADALTFKPAFDDGRARQQVDVIITNPPFGMRTVRGGARDLLEDFLGHISSRLSRNGRVVLLSHAPVSTIAWASSGGLRLVRSFPVRLGGMRCELQHFARFH